MKVERTVTTDAAQARRVNPDGETPARSADAPQAARDPLREAAARDILPMFSEIAEREVKTPNREQQTICARPYRSTLAGSLHPVGPGVFHEVKTMNKKNTNGRKATSTAATSAAKKNHTSTTGAKKTGWWREVTRKDGRVLIAPDGKVYHGTRQEIRDAGLTPDARRSLAEKIATTRHCRDEFHADDPCYLFEVTAAHRRDAISYNNYLKNNARIDISHEQKVEAVAAASYMGMTLSEFCRDAIQAALDAAKNAAGGEIPLTRYERKALKREAATSRQFKIATATVTKAASTRGYADAAQYVAHVATISDGRKANARLIRTERDGEVSVFEIVAAQGGAA